MLELVVDNPAAIEAHLKRLGWIASDEALQGLEPAGDGNMNRTLRVRLKTRTLVLKQSVSYVAKYPSIAAPLERIAVEAAFYRVTATSQPIAARMPRVLGYDADNHLLALQDLGSAADFTDLYASDGSAQRTDISASDRAMLLDWLGKLHGLTVADAETALLENRAMRALNHAHIFDIPLRADNGVALDPITAGLAEAAAPYHADAQLRNRMAQLGEIYLGTAPHASAPALLHGDYYPGAWLRDPVAGVRVIDCEFAFIGAAEFDVGVLIAHFTFARLSQADLMDALKRYVAPAGFSMPLALAFAGAEVIRRLLGVAQLPLRADLETKRVWLAAARQFVVTV